MDHVQQVQRLIDENNRLADEKAEVAEILGTVEWASFVDEKGCVTGVYCPVCGGDHEGKKPRHYSDCRLAYFVYGDGPNVNISDYLMPE